MGTILASAIMADAAGILHDEGFDRWTEATLFTGLNRAQREIVFYKHEANAVKETLALAEGTIQSIPADAFALIKVVRNMGIAGVTPGLAPRLVTEDKMTAYHPYWHNEDASSEVDFYMFDERDPRRFYVSPPQPAASQGRVDIVCAKPPADMVKPAGSYAVAINLDDIYSNVMLYYALFYAYNKDADFSPDSGGRAVAYYNLFLTAVGRKDDEEEKTRPLPAVAIS